MIYCRCVNRATRQGYPSAFGQQSGYMYGQNGQGYAYDAYQNTAYGNQNAGYGQDQGYRGYAQPPPPAGGPGYPADQEEMTMQVG